MQQSSIVLALLAGIVASAAAQAQSTVKAEVNGMVCAFCAQGIEKNLRSLDATRDVYVNLGKKVVAVSFKEGKSASADVIAARIRDAGYDVRRIAPTEQSLEAIKAEATKK